MPYGLLEAPPGAEKSPKGPSALVAIQTTLLRAAVNTFQLPGEVPVLSGAAVG